MMSYSRWVGSVWYTFWSCSSGDTIDGQVLSVDCAYDFTYENLKGGMDSCIDIIKKDPVNHNKSDSEYEELKIYMNRFIEDVECEYGGKDAGKA